MKKKLLTVEMLMFLIVVAIGALILGERYAHSQPVIRTIQSTDQECPLQVAINLSAAGLTRIILGNGSVSNQVRICHISFSTTAAEDITIVSGTQTTTACDTLASNITGPYKSVQSMALDFGPFAQLKAIAGQDICLNQSAAQILGGVVKYALF